MSAVGSRGGVSMVANSNINFDAECANRDADFQSKKENRMDGEVQNGLSLVKNQALLNNVGRLG